jgi:hypothetical protein
MKNDHAEAYSGQQARHQGVNLPESRGIALPDRLISGVLVVAFLVQFDRTASSAIRCAESPNGCSSGHLPNGTAGFENSFTLSQLGPASNCQK